MATALSIFRPGIRDADLSAAVGSPTPVDVDLASPLAPVNNLARVLDGVVFADVFGREVLPPITRAEAMAVPAVARARHIISGTVGAVPLRRYHRDGKTPLSDQGWAAQTAGTVPVYHRHVWTADDLLFYGWSCWSRTNGADGKPLAMDRIPWGRWSVDEVGRVYVAHPITGEHVLVDQSTVVLIPGPHEGILTAAASTIRHAADLQRAALSAAQHPAAYLVLRQTQGAPLLQSSDDPTVNTVDATLADWRKARAANGGVGFVPLGLEVSELGTFDKHLLTEGRNAAAVDVARICSLPADLLDASGPASLTYSNARDNDVRAIQYGVGFYLRAISAVLSMDAVTAHGQSARFDLEEWLEDPVPGAVPATRAQADQADQAAAQAAAQATTDNPPAGSDA
jgi:hypothetical protein